MPAYEKSVFVNCPFDEKFEPLLHAIVLTIAARGFTPRCARESEGLAEPRIVRITRGLMESKYSIHDLSRFQGEGPENHSRFNMPLELGIAMGMRSVGQMEGRAEGNTHNWVALVPTGFLHQKFISDLSGYDASVHTEEAASIISTVAAWLVIQPDCASAKPKAKAILDAFPAYCERLAEREAEELGALSWPAILTSAEEIVAALK